MRDSPSQNEWAIIETPASSSVVGITPLADDPEWTDYDDLPEGRTMGKDRSRHREEAPVVLISTLNFSQAISSNFPINAFFYSTAQVKVVKDMGTRSTGRSISLTLKVLVFPAATSIRLLLQARNGIKIAALALFLECITLLLLSYTMEVSLLLDQTRM